VTSSWFFIPQTSGNLKMRVTASPLLNTYLYRVRRDNSAFSYLQASCILISKLTPASHSWMVRFKKKWTEIEWYWGVRNKNKRRNKMQIN